MIARTVAKGLGWFSIGLGLAEALGGREIGAALGLKDQSGLLRAFGGREIAAGVAVLTLPSPTPGMWARVAGDALDLAALGSGMTEDNPERANLGLAIAVVAGITALDLWCAVKLSTGGSSAPDDDPGGRLPYGYKTGDRPAVLGR